MIEKTGRRFGPPRQEIAAFLELFALSGIAFAQPAFDLLQKNAGIFVERGSSPFTVVLLTVLIVVVPATALWGIEVLVGLAAPRIRPFVHAGLAAALLGIFAIALVKHQTDLGARVLVVLGVIIAGVAAFLVLRSNAVRLWLRYLSVAPIIFAVMFLFMSPVTDAVFATSTGAADVVVHDPKRVVLVVMDEFPLESLLDGTGRIDAAMFPHFAELADETTWYRNSTTVAPFTEAAVPAILTGRYPTDPDAVPAASVHPDNLFTLLGGTYDVDAQEAMTKLCPKSICGGSSGSSARRDAGLRGLADETWDLWSSFASPRRPHEATKLEKMLVSLFSHDPYGDGEQWIQSLERAGGPELDVLHVMLPHEPWRYLPSGQDNGRVQSLGGSAGAWTSDWTALSARQRHLLQVQATDRFVGEIVTRLKRIGAWDDSIVVFTADHGAAFTANEPVRGVSDANWPQIMWTPLFVHRPGQRVGAVDDRPAESIDILPTIADLVDVEIPWKVDGRSLLDEPVPDGPRRIFEWKFNAAQPPPGSSYLSYDGPEGLARVLGARAVPDTGDPKLRIYRLGPYGALVGRPAAPLVADGAPPAGARAIDDVDPDAHLVRWAQPVGSVSGIDENQRLVVAINGTIAGTANVSSTPTDTGRQFWSALDPSVFRKGHNEMRVYEVRGPESAPILTPVEFTFR